MPRHNLKRCRHATPLVLLAVTLGLLATPGQAGASDRFWWGGGIGVGLGSNAEYVAAEPVFGVSLTEKVSVGTRLIYRYRRDDRYSRSFSTEDYGGSVFVRYRVAPFAFLQAEVESLSYEFVQFEGSTARDDFRSVLAGGGFVQPMGHRTSFFATAMYNFSYKENELSPYDEPWVYGAGISFGF